MRRSGFRRPHHFRMLVRLYPIELSYNYSYQRLHLMILVSVKYYSMWSFTSSAPQRKPCKLYQLPISHDALHHGQWGHRNTVIPGLQTFPVQNFTQKQPQKRLTKGGTGCAIPAFDALQQGCDMLACADGIVNLLNLLAGGDRACAGK